MEGGRSVAPRDGPTSVGHPSVVLEDKNVDRAVRGEKSDAGEVAETQRVFVATLENPMVGAGTM